MKVFVINGSTPSSKNSRVYTGKHFIASKATRKWVLETEKYFKTQKDSFLEELSKHSAPYKIEFKFVRGSKHKFDYINPAQTIQDAMVKHGWIEDDNCTVMIPFFAEYEYDKENPRVEIRILNGKEESI
jgi:Holliday junction resolvase RusA-like endonuclease